MKQNTGTVINIGTIEIFRTNVTNPASASETIGRLEILFPSYQFNFDLEDCDKILRVEGSNIPAAEISQHLRSFGHHCEIIL